MINPFYKFFKKEVKLAVAEWPLRPQSETKEEKERKLAVAQQRLSELSNYQKGGIGNDWRHPDDAGLVKNLEEEVKRLRRELGLETEQEASQLAEEKESVSGEVVDPEIKANLDELMKKVRG